MILSPEQLNDIWVRWMRGKAEEYDDPAHMMRLYSHNYSYVTRLHSSWPGQFEDWLWEHGGAVLQANHKRHLYFADESRALMFALTKL